MLTIFTTCKPFRGLPGVHQNNALASWVQMEPRPEVIVFGDEEGATEACQGLGLRHAPHVLRDDWGMPYLNFMWARAETLASHDLLCALSADVMVVGGLMEAARAVVMKFPGSFLGVCRRWDVDGLDCPLDFGGRWRGEVWELIEANGDLYSPCGIDLFLFKRPLSWDVPPFSAGRPKWDNWTLWAAAHHQTPVVDLTGAVTLVHPRHGYGPDGKVGQKAWRGHPGGQRNEDLAAGKTYCLRHVKQAGWLWRMDEAGKVTKVE